MLYLGFQLAPEEIESLKNHEWIFGASGTAETGRSRCSSAVGPRSFAGVLWNSFTSPSHLMTNRKATFLSPLSVAQAPRHPILSIACSLATISPIGGVAWSFLASCPRNLTFESSNQSQSQYKCALSAQETTNKRRQETIDRLAANMAPKRNAQAVAPTTPTTPVAPATPTTATPTKAKASASSANTSEWQRAFNSLIDGYRKTPQRIKLIDVFMAFLIVVGVIQFAYCVLCSDYVRSR